MCASLPWAREKGRFVSVKAGVWEGAWEVSIGDGREAFQDGGGH